MSFLARLSRVIPLLAVLALLAGAVYVAVTFLRNERRAKEVLIVMFTWITGVLSGFFALISLYALFEHNEPWLDLGVCFLAVSLIGLGITRWCNHLFLRHYPHWSKKPHRAKTIHRWPWQRS